MTTLAESIPKHKPNVLEALKNTLAKCEIMHAAKRVRDHFDQETKNAKSILIAKQDLACNADKEFIERQMQYNESLRQLHAAIELEAGL